MVGNAGASLLIWEPSKNDPRGELRASGVLRRCVPPPWLSSQLVWPVAPASPELARATCLSVPPRALETGYRSDLHGLRNTDEPLHFSRRSKRADLLIFSKRRAFIFRQTPVRTARKNRRRQAGKEPITYPCFAVALRASNGSEWSADTCFPSACIPRQYFRGGVSPEPSRSVGWR